MSYVPILSQGVQDRANCFEAIVRISGDTTDRIEEVIGRDNFKWVLLILLVLLALCCEATATGVALIGCGWRRGRRRKTPVFGDQPSRA